MNEKLSKILEEARRNPEIKSKFLETRKAQDPMEEFCKVATAIGYDMTVGELFAMGEEYSDNMLKSCNGLIRRLYCSVQRMLHSLIRLCGTRQLVAFFNLTSGVAILL